MTTADDQIKTPPAHQPTPYPLNMSNRTIATSVAAVAAQDATLLELLVCLFFYYYTNFFRSPLCIEMAMA